MQITAQNSYYQNKNIGFSAIEIKDKAFLARNYGIPLAQKIEKIAKELPEKVKKSGTLTISITPAASHLIRVNAIKTIGRHKTQSIISNTPPISVHATHEKMMGRIEEAIKDAKKRAIEEFKTNILPYRKRNGIKPDKDAEEISKLSNQGLTAFKILDKLG